MPPLAPALPAARHLRPRLDGVQHPTTTVELFFDLVYVFAITQLSHLILGDLTVTGIGRAAFLLLIVWWAWIYTTWMVNWFDRGRRPCARCSPRGCRGHAVTTEWEIEGGHFTDRCQGFIIIALGESIVVTGATAAGAGLSSTVVLCLCVAFVETAALWWLYFGAVAERSRELMSSCED